MWCFWRIGKSWPSCRGCCCLGTTGAPGCSPGGKMCIRDRPMVDLDTRCDVEGPVVLGSYETKVYRVKF